ncbi:MAG TPA: nickel-responsive transcriptional regulator NikR [Polyangiaceae bacterium]|nr:nickel-responsive transcriptional regulator NikR [Polyangiaceae bacterium]
MTEHLVRFGVAMESTLLEQFDRLVEARGGTRSEAFRDLARAAIVRAEVERGVEAVATLTLIYDHHVRDLTERLNELQHALGDRIRSTLHIHLDHDHCLEIIVMHGRSDRLRAEAERILALKGVLQGSLEVFAPQAGRGDSADRGHHHDHDHGREHGHTHGAPGKRSAGRSAPKAPRTATKRKAKK